MVSAANERRLLYIGTGFLTALYVMTRFSALRPGTAILSASAAEYPVEDVNAIDFPKRRAGLMSAQPYPSDYPVEDVNEINIYKRRRA